MLKRSMMYIETLAEDSDDVIELDMVISGFVLSTKYKMLWKKLLDAFIFQYVPTYNIVTKRPKIFDYTSVEEKNRQAYKIYLVYYKRKSWSKEEMRAYHVPLAQALDKLDGSITTVYIIDRLENGTSCSFCSFNKNKEQLSKGGDYDVTPVSKAPGQQKIGSACPVAPGSSDFRTSCRAFNFDLERNLAFHTIQKEREDGEKEEVDQGSKNGIGRDVGRS